MTQYHDPKQDDAEEFDDVPGVLLGPRAGWTPELAGEVDSMEYDENGYLVIDEDHCYRHVDCEDPYCVPAHVVLESEGEEYEAELDFLRREVVTLHTNLKVVETIARFPWDFYASGGEPYFEWSAITNYQQSIVMAWRLWADDDQGSLTLKRFRTRVMRAAKPEYQLRIRERLRPLDPSRRFPAVLERVHEVRNKRLGHVDRAYQLDSALPKSWPSVDDLWSLAQGYGEFLNALMFRDSQYWVAKYIVDNLEWHLNELALGSDWSRVHDEDYSAWRDIIRPKLEAVPNAAAMVADLAERRCRVGRPAIDWGSV